MSLLPSDGYLFKVVGQVGTRSEGPVYCLQSLVEWKEFKDIPVLVIINKSELFQPDKTLEPFLNEKVRIEGVMSGKGLEYTSIKPLNG